MSIKINVEKVLHKDYPGKCYKIKNIVALEQEKLPYEYLDGYPKVMLTYMGNLKIIPKSGSPLYLERNSIITEDKFNELLEIIKEAGLRLKKINDERRKLAEEWNGEIEFVI